MVYIHILRRKRNSFFVNNFFKKILSQKEKIIRKALVDYADKNIDYLDSYLAAYAGQIGPRTIFTLDKKHFKRLEGDIKFLEP